MLAGVSAAVVNGCDGIASRAFTIQIVHETELNATQFYICKEKVLKLSSKGSIVVLS